MVVGFTTTYAINHCISPLTLRVRISLMQHYVIKFVSDVPQVGSFLLVLQFPPPRHYITEILLKVALNNITLTTISIIFFLPKSQSVSILTLFYGQEDNYTPDYRHNLSRTLHIPPTCDCWTDKHIC
jgi:hypothetical protein